ncbi:MAG: histidine kinase [Bacteroidota bacterium]
MNRSTLFHNLSRLLDHRFSRLAQHLLFWAVAYLALLFLFAYNNRITFSDYLYTALFLISLCVVVYGNLFLLIDRLFSKGRLIFYLIGIPTLLILGGLVNEFTFNTLSDWLFPGYYFIAYFEWFDLFLFMLSFWGLSTLLRFSKSQFRLAEAQTKMKVLEKERLNAELEALRAQINPHFLFNSLNSVYSMALEQEADTPDTILKLSGLLRYMLYETQTDRISIKQELDQITHYIDLQALRAEVDADIQFKQSGQFDDLQIAPLLLIPLVENGFKYGIKGARDEVFIHVSAKAIDHELHFSVSNNKGIPDSSLNQDVGGIGLKNLQRRLELIYPQKHDLHISETKQRFTVDLKIQCT